MPNMILRMVLMITWNDLAEAKGSEATFWPHCCAVGPAVALKLSKSISVLAMTCTMGSWSDRLRVTQRLGGPHTVVVLHALERIDN